MREVVRTRRPCPVGGVSQHSLEMDHEMLQLHGQVRLCRCVRRLKTLLDGLRDDIHIGDRPHGGDGAQDNALGKELLRVCEGAVQAARDLLDGVTLSNAADFPLHGRSQHKYSVVILIDRTHLS